MGMVAAWFKQLPEAEKQVYKDRAASKRQIAQSKRLDAKVKSLTYQFLVAV